MQVRPYVPFVAGVLMCVLCINLGFWQLRRADYKLALQARFDAASEVEPVQDVANLRDSQRVILRGQWLAAQTVFLDNRVYHDRAGFDVLTPLRLADNDGIVTINRGWLAGTGDRSHLPPVITPSGVVTLQGMVQAPVAAGFSLGESAVGDRMWQHLDLQRLAAQIGKPVAPWLVLQESAADDGLVRDWPRPDFGIDMHRGYALQWFAFAALAAGLVLWFGWKKFSVNGMSK